MPGIALGLLALGWEAVQGALPALLSSLAPGYEPHVQHAAAQALALALEHGRAMPPQGLHPMCYASLEPYALRPFAPRISVL